MTISKMLKELRHAVPHLRWMRQKEHDQAENDEHEAIYAFAGLKGKQGIRFGLSVADERPEIQAKAKAIANRLIRGDQ